MYTPPFVMEAGYAKLSRLMSYQDESAIYRRFGNLNSLNLLYLQAEITHLEQDLEILAKRDALHPDRGEFYTRDWWSLSQSDDNEEDMEQWAKVIEIREKLGEYNRTLIELSQIARLGPPSSYDLHFLRRWLVRPHMGNLPLIGLDQHAYFERYEKDMVAVRARTDSGPLSRFFTCSIIPKWNRVVGDKFKKPVHEEGLSHQDIYEYKDGLLTTVIHITTSVVASLLPLCSIVAQYFVRDQHVRLSIIVAFTAVFAMAVAAMTNARTIDVFTATCAYAAVNVVFLSNTID